MADDGEQLLALMALFMFFTGSGVAAVVLNGLAIANGFGFVDFELYSSVSQGSRATFGYSDVCIGPLPSSGSSRSQVLNDDAGPTSSTCIPYGEATVAKLAPLVPVGEHVLAAACAQVAERDLTPAIAGSIMAMCFVVAVVVHLRRAFTVCCCSIERGRSMYACTTRTVVVLLAVGFAGALITVSTVASFGDTPGLWLFATDSAWEAFESSASGARTSSMNIDVEADSSEWFGIFQIIPCAICVFMGTILEAATHCIVKPEQAIFPCCSCGGGGGGANAAGAIGLCGETWISPDDCNVSCAPLCRSRRRTTNDRIDNWVADWMRFCVMPPPGGVHIAAIVLGILATSGPLFSLESTGRLYNGTRSLSSSVTVVYTMTSQTSCLTSTSLFLAPSPGGAVDCFDNTSPRRLSLAGDPTAGGDTGADFSLVAMGAVADLATSATTLAFVRILAGVCVAVVLVAGVLCNMREGAAARFFKCWGRFAALALLFGAAGGAAATAAYFSVTGEMGRNPLLAALRGARLDDDDDYGQDLSAVVNPVGPPFRFEARRVDITFDAEAGTAALVLGILSAVFLVPVSACMFLGTFNGEGQGAPAGGGGAGAAGGTAAAAQSAVMLAAVRAAERAPSPAPAPAGPPSAALRSEFGCLADIPSPAKRALWQAQAQELAQHLMLIRGSGFGNASSMEASACRGKAKQVKRRAEEILAGGGASFGKPAATPTMPPAASAPRKSATTFVAPVPPTPAAVPAVPSFPGTSGPPGGGAPPAWGGGYQGGGAAGAYPGAAAPSAPGAPGGYGSYPPPPGAGGASGADSFAL